MPQKKKSAQARPKRFLKHVRVVPIGITLCFAMALPLAARVEHKPGFNTFSPEQDVELGQQATREVESQLRVVSDAQINDYISRLGRKLAGIAPGYRFPYSFHVVQAKEINAFALPGGPIYIHTGTIAAAANEAQLAGVLAHEISHVALRHSTNQASKAMLAQAPLAVLGGIVSGGSLAGQLAQLGIAFGLNSVFLKFSRGAERQADEQGAQMMYDAGYDPRAMAQFFETIQRESGRSNAAEFLSSHPNPGNRQKDVTALIPNLGPSKTYTLDNGEFEAVRRRLGQGTISTQAAPRPSVATRPQQPSEPSRQFRVFNAQGFSVGYPDNWQAYGQGTSTLTLVPPEGVIPAVEGSLPAIAYGALISIYEPPPDARRWNLQSATAELIRELQQSNPQLRVTGRATPGRLSGQEALSVTAAGQSPFPGETEMNWIVTTLRPEGLWYVVFIAPQRSWNSYRPVFQQMLDSVRFSR